MGDLFKIIPLGALAASYTRQDGITLTGDTGAGFDIVDSFHSPLDNPSYATSTNINTAYGGGGGTGWFSDGGLFEGGETPIADGTSPASYGTLPPYSDYYGTAY